MNGRHANDVNPAEHDEHPDHEFLGERLRGLAASGRRQTTLAGPALARARGIRRRNRGRMLGAATVAACAVAASAWTVDLADPGSTAKVGSAASAPGQLDSATASPPRTGQDDPEAELRRRIEAEMARSGDPTHTPVPAVPERPWMGSIDESFLPKVPGLVWGVDFPVEDDFGMATTVSTRCPGFLTPSHGGGGQYKTTPAGSMYVLMVQSTYGSLVSKAVQEATAADMVAQWRTRLDGCMTRKPGGPAGTDAWTWSADGKRGDLVVTRRGSNVAVISTEIVAADPDFPIKAEHGPALLENTTIRE